MIAIGHLISWRNKIILYKLCSPLHNTCKIDVLNVSIRLMLHLNFVHFKVMLTLCLYVRLFVRLSFSSHSRIFSNISRRHLCRWRAPNFDLYSTLMALSSEGSLAYHTYCDTGHPFIMVISEDPWHSHLLPSVWQWSCHYLFLRLRSVASGIRTPNLPLGSRTL